MAGTWLRTQVGILRESAREVLRGRWPKSYMFTFIAEMGALVGGLATLKVAGDALGATGFGEYAVARRIVSVLAFPLLAGMGTSVARYVSRTIGSNPSGATAIGYSLSSLFIGVVIVATFSIVVWLQPDRFARLFYGDARFASLSLPILLAIAGLYAHVLVYANYRGRLRMWPANLLQLCNLGLAPPLAVLASHRTTGAAVGITGVVWLTTSALVGGWGVLSGGLRVPSRGFLVVAAGDLLRFGLPRVVGEFALFGLFALPTFYVAHTAGVERAGFLSFALSLVQVLSSLFATVGILLLPYVSRQVGEGNWERIAKVVANSVGASLLVTLVAVMGLHVTLAWLIPLVMGSSFTPAVPPARWLITGAIPFVVYTLLRDPLDAIAVWPYNTVNLSVTLLAVMGLLWGASGWISPAPAVAFGMLVLGALTLLSWRRAFGRARTGPPAPPVPAVGGTELGV